MPSEKSRCLPVEATGLLAAAEAAGCGKPDEVSAGASSCSPLFLGKLMEVGCFMLFCFSNFHWFWVQWSTLNCGPEWPAVQERNFGIETLGTNDKCDDFLDRLARLRKRGVSLMCITSDLNLHRTTWISFLSTTEVWIHET